MSYQTIITQQRADAAKTAGYVFGQYPANNSMQRYPALTGTMARATLVYWINDAHAIWRKLMIDGMSVFTRSTLLDSEALIGDFVGRINDAGALLKDLEARGQFAQPKILPADTAKLWYMVDRLAIVANTSNHAPSSWDVARWAVKSATSEALTKLSQLPSTLFNFIVPQWLRVALILGAGVWVYSKVANRQERE